MKTTMTVAVALLCAGLTASANAAITAVGGDVELIAAPVDAQLNALTSADKIRVWDELQDVTLTAALAYDADAPGVYDDESDLANLFLAAGTRVASHYVHFDSPASQEADAKGTVTFRDRIIAVIARGDKAADGGPKLDNSDFLGAPTLYSNNVGNRGLEFNTDAFTISPDGKTLTVDFRISSPGDYMRVLTAVPAPGATALAALGTLLIARRRRA
jgi:hypothetical protein